MLENLLDELNKAIDTASAMQTQDTEFPEEMMKDNRPITTPSMPIQKVEAGKFTIYESKQPFYRSTFFGVPILYIGLAGLAYQFLIKKKGRGKR